MELNFGVAKLILDLQSLDATPAMTAMVWYQRETLHPPVGWTAKYLAAALQAKSDLSWQARAPSCARAAKRSKKTRLETIPVLARPQCSVRCGQGRHGSVALWPWFISERGRRRNKSGLNNTSSPARHGGCVVGGGAAARMISIPPYCVDLLPRTPPGLLLLGHSTQYLPWRVVLTPGTPWGFFHISSSSTGPFLLLTEALLLVVAGDHLAILSFSSSPPVVSIYPSSIPSCPIPSHHRVTLPPPRH